MQELRSLAYPVAQLLMGALKLMPSAGFFPLRLRLARALVGLERDTRLLIPLSPTLLDMLSWKGVSTAPAAPCASIYLVLGFWLLLATASRWAQLNKQRLSTHRGHAARTVDFIENEQVHQAAAVGRDRVRRFCQGNDRSQGAAACT